MTRRISPEGLALIKQWEECRLTSYRDAVGVWTIGYGSTGPHVRPGMSIPQSDADALLFSDLRRFERAVEWPAAGFVDTEIGCFMKPAVAYAATTVWA